MGIHIPYEIRNQGATKSSQPVSADICAIRFPTDIGLAAFFALTRMKPHAKEGPLEEKSLRCFGYLGPGGRMILVEAQLVLQLP